jgi:hypothetical protein
MIDNNKSLGRVARWIILALYCAVSLFVIAEFSLANTGIDKEHAWMIIKKEIFEENPEGTLVYIYQIPLTAGQEIKSWGRSYTVPDKFDMAWFIFVDDQPGANWEHACRYIFVDQVSGEYHIINSRTPPEQMELMDKIFP